MRDLPYFKWYPADAEGDEAYSLMSNAEVGFFHRCLNRSWINDGLPADINQRARVLGLTVPVTQKLWATVGGRFELADGRYRNPRQELERTKARTKSEKATKSVRTRYERSENVAPRALTRPDSDSSEVGVISEVHEYSEPPALFKAPTAMLGDESWPKFIEHAKAQGIDGSEVDWTEAQWEWSLLDFQQKLDAHRGLERDVNGRENCLPKSYLRKRMWQRPERKTAKPGKVSYLDDVEAGRA